MTQRRITTAVRIATPLVFSAFFSFGQGQNDSRVLKTTLCELAQYPEQYVGKMVEVRASVAGNDLWIDDFEEKPACPAWMGIIAVLPDHVRPKPDFDVVKDDSFQQFFDNLRKGMNVQATFEGRFEAVYTLRNKKQVGIGDSQPKHKGFGNKGQYGGRLVLHRVTEILARRVPRL